MSMSEWLVLGTSAFMLVLGYGLSVVGRRCLKESIVRLNEANAALDKAIALLAEEQAAALSCAQSTEPK
jgi:hypothetical protein